MPEYLAIIFSSGIVAAIITYISTQHANNRSHRVKYITEERQNWRKDIKKSVAEFCSSTDQNRRIYLKTFLTLSLNPFDKEDQKIVNCLDSLLMEISGEKIKELEKRVSYLLKHDWERAKREIRIVKIKKKEKRGELK